MDAAPVQESLADFMSSVELLSAFTKEELEQLAGQCQSRFMAFGETLCAAGERAEGVYVIRSGSIRVFAEEHGKELSLGVRKAREVVAEMAMLRDYRHEFSARASGKAEVIFIPRQAIVPVIAGNPAAQAFVTSFVAIGSAGGVVARLFDLRGKVDKAELEELVRSVGVKRVAAGREILAQDSREDRRLYVVRHGEVRVSRTEQGTDYALATLGHGEIFGEKACLMRQEQMASVVATADTTLLIVPEKTVHQILERNPKLREVLEERIRYLERELQRQKKLAERRKLPVVLDLQSKPEFGERLVRRFPLVEQAEEMDCGAACLAMICRHYGIPMTLGKLRELANVTTHGVQCTFDALLGFELPFIIHWEGYHYVVVYGVSKQKVWLADPALGFRQLSGEDFDRGWG